MNSNQQLVAALQVRTQAQEQLQLASAELGRKQQAADERRIAAEQAAIEADASTVETALRLEQRRRDAEAVANAANRELGRARAAHHEREMDLAAAQEHLRKVAKQVLCADIHAQLEEFRATLKALQRLRTSLLGAYLVTPNALADREWHELDCRSLLSADVLQIGLPIISFSIFSAQDMSTLTPDWKSQRALVNQKEVEWTERLAQLERGEGFESAAARDAA